MELDRFSRARLDWLFDNEPDMVRELVAKGEWSKLEEIVERAVISMARYAHQLQSKGMPSPEAYDLACELMLTPASPYETPAMSDDPPKPLSWKERNQVLRKLGEKAK